MINWKLRLQNKATLWSLICLVVSIAYRVLDAAHVIPPFSQDFILEIAADLLSVLGLIFGTLFSAALSLAGWLFSGRGIVIGIIIGYLAVRYFRNREAIGAK